MNAHTNGHVHTTTHICTCNTNMHVHLRIQNHTHTHMHKQHHVHAGWILSSLYFKPGGAWQDSGDVPSGWGYSRPAEQGGKLLFALLSLMLCHSHYSLYTKYHTTFRGIWIWTGSIAIEAVLWQNLNHLCDKKLALIFKCEMRGLQEWQKLGSWWESRLFPNKWIF